MRCLPAINVGSIRCCLPMADRSAEALAEAMVDARIGRPPASLAAQLAIDPPLVLWAVLTASQRDGLRPQSIDDVAAWLQHAAWHAFDFDSSESGKQLGANPRLISLWADRVAASLRVAELAAMLARATTEGNDPSQGSPCPLTEDALEIAPRPLAGEGAHSSPRPLAGEGLGVRAGEAYFAALLADGRAWIALTALDGQDAATSPDSQDGWGGCLREYETSLAGQDVSRAMSILAGPGDRPDGVDLNTCHARATEGRRRWLEEVPGAFDRLEWLVEHLARLDALESRFEEVLERAKLEAMAEFAAGAGHEINNPLAIISGRAQLLLEEETDPERRRELASIHAQAMRAHEMIADMRLFSRPPRPEPRRFDLVELVDEVIANVAESAAERAIAAVRSGEAGPLWIEADRDQLHVAIAALCRNSLEAIGRDGRIEITLSRAAGEVVIRVADDGPGILPEERSHLFEPFYSARQAGRGLGFGLSKCWRIVTNHGGRIEVESRPGEGATFKISGRWAVGSE